MPPVMLRGCCRPLRPGHRPRNPPTRSKFSAPGICRQWAGRATGLSFPPGQPPAVVRARWRPLRSAPAGRPACLRIASPDSVWQLGCPFGINSFLPDNSIPLPRTPSQSPASKRVSDHQIQPSFKPPASIPALPSEHQPDSKVSFISSFYRLHAIITLHLGCF